MGKAKEIIVKVIPSKIANDFVRKNHYSGKVVNNSVLHFGCFLNGLLHGVMSFGSPLDKRKVLGLVEGTLWNEMLELNRMAFDDYLPKNSESRCLSIAFKLIKKNAPHIKWILSFADGTQCGDGAIYRASGFLLTGIKKNNQIWAAPTGARESRTSLTDNRSHNEQAKARQILSRVTATKGRNILHSASLRPGIGAISCAVSPNGASSMRAYLDAGWEPLRGFQLRYIYLLDKSCKITVPILPFSEIDRQNARMYKGYKLSATSIVSDASSNQLEEGSARLTVAL